MRKTTNLKFVPMNAEKNGAGNAIENTPSKTKNGHLNIKNKLLKI